MTLVPSCSAGPLDLVFDQCRLAEISVPIFCVVLQRPLALRPLRASHRNTKVRNSELLHPRRLG